MSQRRRQSRHQKALHQKALHQKARSGIILLIVLSLLAVFTLVAVMFVIVSSQYAIATTRTARAVQSKKDGTTIAEEALFSLLRGPRNPSALTWHELLGDMYGLDSVRATVQPFFQTPNGVVVSTAPTLEADGQFLVLNIRLHASQLSSYPAKKISPVRDFYNGHVVTFLDGPFANRSSRIVRYTTFNGLDGIPDTIDDIGQISLEMFEAPPASEFPISNASLSLVGTTVVINGGIFNGTGGGFDSNTGKLDSFIHFDRGPDGQFGVANVNDDGAGSTDDSVAEARGDCDDLKLPTALLPNVAGYPLPPTFPYHLGGVNEDYDAADFQNMFLASLPADPTRPPAVIPSFHRPHLINFWMNWVGEYILGRAPYNQPRGNWRGIFANPVGSGLAPQHVNLIVAIKRSILFRPLLEDHPNFNGSNPDFGFFGFGGRSQYDVDNDADGKNDSIWIDLGLPATYTPDGKRFKPLFAPLIVDLDGKLNLNVHGQLAHSPGGAFLWHPGPDGIWGEPGDDNGNGTPNDILEAGMDNSATSYRTDDISIAPNRGGTMGTIARGLGFGAAEVSLAPLFGGVSPTPVQLTEYANVLEKRYYSRTSSVRPGSNHGFNDSFGILAHQEIPLFYPWRAPIQAGFPWRLGGYATPCDILGLGGIATAYAGSPTQFMNSVAQSGSWFQSELIDDPYEVRVPQLGKDRTSDDSPYPIADLETILRLQDPDVSRRTGGLASLAPSTVSRRSNQVTRSVTTHSSHVPTINAAYSGESRSGTYPHVIDLLRSRFVNVPNNEFSAQLRLMLPFEMFRGEMFDVNRPFGNGRDDDMDGVVDEADEFTGNSIDDDRDGQTDELDELDNSWSDPQLAGTLFHRSDANLPAVRIKLGGDNQRNDDYLEKTTWKQIYARNLFVLAMLAKGRHRASPTSLLDSQFDFDGVNTNNRKETARILAQWAINIVDFRDPDSIMTPFEFDFDPFDGWNVDGNPNTVEQISDPDVSPQTNPPTKVDRGLVFGCERPELLLTETISFHARRTEDLPVANRTSDTTNPDDDSDQRLLPRGSLFFELYNPWSDQLGSGLTGDFTRPGEFYPFDNGARSPPPHVKPSWGPGVALDKRTPVTPTGSSPIWRVLIVKEAAIDRDPADPSTSATDVERSVYFVNGGLPNDARDGTPYLPYGPAPVTPIKPGRYAVVGSKGNYERPNPTIPGNPTGYITTIGRRKNETPNDTAPGNVLNFETRRITLIPHANPDFSRVVVEDNFSPVGNSLTEPAVGSVPNAAAIVIDKLSVSEPVGGYPVAPPGAIQQLPNGDEYYTAPLDEPLDKQSSFGKPEFAGVFKNGTTTRYRGLHLQRLADPTLPWNPLKEDSANAGAHNANLPVNPYITIDSMSVSLSAFNGVTDDSAFAMKDNIQDEEYDFRTLQRGDSDTNNRRLLWKHEKVNPGSDPTADGPLEGTPPPRVPPHPGHEFNAYLFHSLGYLNHGYWPFHPNGQFVGEPTVTQINPTTNVLEVAKNPKNNSQSPHYFPWLVWNNRPFASPLELMHVPYSSAFSLARDFDISASLNDATEVYNAKSRNFGHLLNFFWSKPSSSTISTGTEVPSRLFRIFDYLTMPSPFPDAHKWFNPIPLYFDRGIDGAWGAVNTDDDGNGVRDDIYEAGFGDDLRLPHKGPDGFWGTNADDDGISVANDFFEAGWPRSDDIGPFSGWAFRPPFNRLSRFRDPGRINLNTIPYSWTTGPNGVWGNLGDDDGNGVPEDEAEAGWPGSDDLYQSFVWDGLTYFARTQPNFRDLFRSFEGHDLSNTNQFPVAAYPTHLARPFRSAVASDLVPNTVPPLVPPLSSLSSAPTRPWPSALSRDDEILATLFRPDLSTPTQPAFSETSSFAAVNTNRNPFHRYHSIQRLHNLVTSHSNVFAVWITVGYFEVHDWPGGPDAQHPDGLQLGRELGWDSGDARRHRSFFIVDRSIPVAYEPGQDHNVGQCVVLRRHLD